VQIIFLKAKGFVLRGHLSGVLKEEYQALFWYFVDVVANKVVKLQIYCEVVLPYTHCDVCFGPAHI
jgi:hypothetical protein